MGYLYTRLVLLTVNSVITYHLIEYNFSRGRSWVQFNHNGLPASTFLGKIALTMVRQSTNLNKKKI